MIKVLIVDDEYIMRQGLKYMIDWEQEGFEIVGEALVLLGEYNRRAVEGQMDAYRMKNQIYIFVLRCVSCNLLIIKPQITGNYSIVDYSTNK